jgi:hypothetical protein
MRLYQLTENDAQPSPLTYQYLQTNVFPHCTQYLKLRNITNFESFKTTKHLYRGITQPNNGVRMLTTHSVRKPRNTSLPLHNIIGKVLTSIVGYDPRSTNPVFCTSNAGGTEYYGQPQIVLPTDNFEYFFLDHIRDLWELITHQLAKKEYVLPCVTDGTLTDIAHYINELQNWNVIPPPQQQQVENFLHCLFTKIYPANLNKNIEFAVANGYEVIFKTPRYYVISLEAFKNLIP